MGSGVVVLNIAAYGDIAEKYAKLQNAPSLPIPQFIANKYTLEGVEKWAK
jgi:hypothetical protein